MFDNLFGGKRSTGYRSAYTVKIELRNANLTMET